MLKQTPKAMATLLVALTLTTASSFTTAQDEKPRRQVILNQQIKGPLTIRPQRIEGQQNMILLNDSNSAKAVTRIELGKFWIGLNCAEVSPALRSQLKLKKGVGLLVVNAFEGSPSQKAGLKQHDIIVNADGKEIGAVGQLIQAVQKAGEEEIKLDIIREGQPKTINVKSAKRPSEQQTDSIYLPQAGGEHRILFRTPEGAITLIEPGVVVAPNKNWTPARVIDRRIPSGVSITIKRQAGEPASIHVERDDKTWDITPDKMDQLPKDLQPHVKAMLAPAQMKDYPPEHPLPLTRWIQSKVIGQRVKPGEKVIELPKFTPLGNHLTTKEPEADGNVKPVESEIEKLKRELSEEMKQLRKAVEELKKSNEAAKN
jgi:hypothetical protein